MLSAGLNSTSQSEFNHLYKGDNVCWPVALAVGSDPIITQTWQRMIAFVAGIGNDNAYRDSIAIKDLLEAQNAEVFHVSDCTIKEFKEKFNAFEAAIQPGDTAFVYFAGHAVKYENSLRLIAKSNSSTQDIEADSMNLDQMIARSIARDSHRC